VLTLEHALALLNEKLTVLPCFKKDKHPVYPWKKYQKEPPTRSTLHRLFNKEAFGADAICFITGRSSGNLEFIDFDQKGRLYKPWAKKVREQNRKLFDKLVVESTQSGGIHVGYRCQREVKGNLKLAKDVNGEVLIETRGEGGLILVAPSDGYALIQNDFFKMPVLNREERKILLDAAIELNELQLATGGIVSGPTSVPMSLSPSEPNPLGKFLKFPDITKEAHNVLSARMPDFVNRASPFDDFNHRGDILPILEKHDWKLIGKKGENFHFERPGKNKGSTSATFNGDIFYVFSSNAIGFESEKGYSKAGVVNSLEGKGDWKITAEILASRGYGDDLKTVDIGSLITRVKDLEIISTAFNHETEAMVPEKLKKKPFPESLLKVGGFIGSLADFTYDNAPVPNKVMSFVGALSANAHLISRRLKGQNGTMPNLYLLGLGHSGSGKDFPRKINTELLARAGITGEIVDRLASSEGLEDLLYLKNRLLLQCDEVDSMLEAIKSGKETRYANIMSYLLSVYSYSGRSMPMRNKAGIVGREIICPHLTLFGTATPKFYYESLSEKMLTGGLFARMLAFESYTRERYQARDEKPIPDDLIQVARWLSEISDHQETNLPLGYMSCNPIQILSTVKARAEIEAFSDLVYQKQLAADKDGDICASSIWSRALENVNKLSLIRASSDDPYNIEIGLSQIEWAARVVEFCVENMLASLDHREGGSKVLDNAEKIYQYLRKHGRGKWVARTPLRNTLHLDKKEFDEAITDLMDREKIAQNLINIKRSQKKSLVYLIPRKNKPKKEADA